MNRCRGIFIFAMLSVIGTARAEQSTDLSQCFGTTKKGHLEHAVKLPGSGDNFESYSTLGGLLGRTYVHSTTAKIILDAYAELYKIMPKKVFKYGETGFAEGGPFKPHKTHQNGLSVDFMVPVFDENGHSVHLPTHPLNKFGYEIEFDQNSRFEKYRLDYSAMAAHIKALHQAALAHKVDIWRVIFDPKLQPKLFDTPDGPYLKRHIQFSTKPSWVRHDEHYHVDFAIPCG